MFERVEFRNDDVLISQKLTPAMVKSLQRGSMFEQFKETDKLFEANNTPCILAVLSEGIDEQPQWVKYIKNNLHRFQVEMHGNLHLDYRNYSDKDGFLYLKEAKDKIEQTFGTPVTQWYVPFGRKAFPYWGKEVCDKLGIKYNKSVQGLPHYRFHYWNPKDIIMIEKEMDKYGF